VIFIGIDPGLSGAVAVIHPDGKVEVIDTPVALVKKNKHDYSAWEMARILGRFERDVNVVCGIESVHSMPKQGVASSFSFGRGLGLWEGILASFEIGYGKVTPQAWKKLLMSGMGKEKDSSRLQAQRLFPTAELNLKKHHGRADALLIAEFMRRTCSPKGDRT
jgi:crossover junction endodeoxyribonuclease RuvC